MENVIEKNNCTGCMACYNICPKNAIEIFQDQDGFQYPKINRERCVECGLCQKVCPVIHKLKESSHQVEVYACKSKNEQTRMQSSSGGIFSLIAEYILEQNGVVFGVRMNENMEAVHDYVESKNDLDLFRGSKYLQSQMNHSYQKVKEFLEQKRKVLFTGTPCQVEGLLSYLGKEYDNLYTQDIICHGVPSPKVWKKYMEYKKKQEGEYPKRVNFRRKDILGWSNFQMGYEYSNKEENVHHDNDPYMKLFLRNFDLRESCYHCHFKKLKRKSDITIADFWGINMVAPEFNDEKGASTILVNSKKGQEIFKNIQNKIEFFSVDMAEIIKYNSPVCKSVEYNDAREEFFKDLEDKDFAFLIEKFL